MDAEGTRVWSEVSTAGGAGIEIVEQDEMREWSSWRRVGERG